MPGSKTPDRTTEREVRKPLERIAARLAEIKTESDDLYAERLAVYRRGVELHVTHEQMGNWSARTSVAVSKVLSKAAAG